MRFIPFVNLLLIVLIGCSIAGIIFVASRDTPPAPLPVAPLKTVATLPKNPFQTEEFAYLEEGPLTLAWAAPRIQLPNLQTELTYYGIIERPDLISSTPLFHLGLAGAEDYFSVKADEPFYLTYERPSAEEESAQGNYLFSTKPTSLWLEMHPTKGGKMLEIAVHMRDEQGEEVREPAKYKQFVLPALEMPKGRTAGWEIADTRVDSTLLIRQKARWVGKDRFLQEHGGKEFASTFDRERIDFLAGAEPYSCFVKPGDFLIWKENRWQAPLSGEATFGLPLLVTKKVEEKVISFELWDPEGRGKTSLNLIRSKDLGGMPNLAEEFRFVGAKTWAQFIVESHSQRLILKPHDWLVLTAEGWTILDSPDAIDAFVSQKITGPLLVLDKMHKQNGKQMLTGHLFNSTRTEVQDVELLATSGYTATPSAASIVSKEVIETYGGEECK